MFDMESVTTQSSRSILSGTDGTSADQRASLLPDAEEEYQIPETINVRNQDRRTSAPELTCTPTMTPAPSPNSTGMKRDERG